MRGAITSVSAGIVAAALSAAPPESRAQDTTLEPVDIEVPTVIVEPGVAAAAGVDDTTELDLANIVQSAARGVTTVQEAPAIVTVITSDEIADRHYRFIEEIVDTVPGWLRLGAIHSQFPFPLARGQIQAAQLLHDGLSLYEPFLNIGTLSRVTPVEIIKRFEFITGPGGVLWGSNSLLGIMNIITKDAEDVDGVEVGATVGHGNGDRQMVHAYAMAGMPELLNGKAKLFVHGSVESYVGAGFEMPMHHFGSPLPQPNAITMWGPLTRANPPRSLIVSLTGKLTFGKWQLRTHVPITDRHAPLGFPGFVVDKDSPEDTARGPDGMLACPQEEPFLDPNDSCVDKGRTSRDNSPNFSDRYAVAEYRTRFAGGRAGLSSKAYLIQFVREFEHIGIMAPIPGLTEGGVSFSLDITNYRTGGTFDGDFELPRGLRLLYGAEAFHEWTPNTVDGARQGNGTQSTILAPYDLARLPIACPRDVNEMGQISYVEGCPLTWAFPASRSVVGAYTSGQWRATRKLILDLGGRVQVSPEGFGDQSYGVTPTFAGTVVYNFIPNWHLKLNAAQGFRPPANNNLISNGETIQIDGREDLEVETTTAAQAEVNARIFKGERKIRELNFRADYSYTVLENLVQIVGARFQNTARRDIHSVEFLGKLYVQGGHRFELGYTWLKLLAADTGVHRSLPDHWFNLGAVFNLIDDKLMATTTVRVLAAMEDVNMMAEHRNFGRNEQGRSINLETMSEGLLTVNPNELVFDRLPPVADIKLGLSWFATKGLEVRATAENVLNERYYQPDAFLNYEPRLEYLPNPAEDFRAYLSAIYQY